MFVPIQFPPHTPEYYPFRLQTKSFFTFSPVFLPLPRHFSPAIFIFLQANTQSSSLLRSRCPNHLNLQHLTTSAPSLRQTSISPSCALPFQTMPHSHQYQMCRPNKKLEYTFQHYIEFNLNLSQQSRSGPPSRHLLQLNQHYSSSLLKCHYIFNDTQHTW